MTRRHFLGTAAVLLLILALGPGQALAQDIKARMAARLPTINALKDQGVVGEGADGLLHFMGSARPRADVVQAENADRRAVYAAIARQQGVSPAVVGQRRALQIFRLARPGHWIQEGGTWRRK